MNNIMVSASSIPVMEDADICVIGGSATGVFAAIRAARLGAKVILVEQQGNLGGTATSGMVCVWHSLYDIRFEKKIISGLTEELLKRLEKRGALFIDDPTRAGHPSRMSQISMYTFNPEEMKIELDEMLLEAGVTVYLHTTFSEPHKDEDGELKAVIVECKEGRRAIRAQFFIDASGEGDLCHRLGIGDIVPNRLQPATTCAMIYGYPSVKDSKKILFEHLQEYNLPELGWDRFVPGAPEVSFLCKPHVPMNCMTSRGLTNGEIEGRRQIRAIMDILKKYGNSDQSLVLMNMSSYIAIREGRRLHCAYRITGEDIRNAKRFDDAIANSAYPIDIHHSDKPGATFWYVDGMMEYERDGYPYEVTYWKNPEEIQATYWQIPYRSMVVSEFPNLLVCGRAMDADQEGFAGIRIMINMNQTGEAAGVAAWLCIKEKVSNIKLDPTILRAKLAEGGSIVL